MPFLVRPLLALTSERLAFSDYRQPGTTGGTFAPSDGSFLFYSADAGGCAAADRTFGWSS